MTKKKYEPLDILRARVPREETPTEPTEPGDNHPFLVLEVIDADGVHGVFGVKGVTDLDKHVDKPTHFILTRAEAPGLSENTRFMVEQALSLPLSIMDETAPYWTTVIQAKSTMIKIAEALVAGGLHTEQGIARARLRKGPPLDKS
jgi:hypothetical protein